MGSLDSNVGIQHMLSSNPDHDKRVSDSRGVNSWKAPAFISASLPTIFSEFEFQYTPICKIQGQNPICWTYQICPSTRMAITAKTVLVLWTMLHHLSCSALPSPKSRSVSKDQVSETLQGLEGPDHSQYLQSITGLDWIGLTGRH